MNTKTMKRITSFFLILFMTLSFVIVSIDSAKAAAYGIKGNGTGGISININGSPYSDYARIRSWGQYAYGPSGCAWFASARVRQLTGKGDTIYAGSTWYNSAYASYGFSRGSTPRAKALACYETHVSVVEAVNGNTLTISEGGSGYYSDAAHGYCVIMNMNKNTVMSARGGRFLGFVYLDGATASPAPSATVSHGLSYTNLKVEWTDTWNAELYGRILNPNRNRISQVGVNIWDASGNQVVAHKENCGLNYSYVDQRLNIVGEALPSGLRSGTTYTYQMWATANGQTCYSNKGTFTTQTADSITFSNFRLTSLTSSNAVPRCTMRYTGTRPSSVGIYVGTSTTNLRKVASDRINHNQNPFDTWYNLNTEARMRLNSRTTYYYRFYAIINGKEYQSGIYSFRTK